jgi:hypothetical protein
MTVLAALELWQEEAEKADRKVTSGQEDADFTQNRDKVRVSGAESLIIIGYFLNSAMLRNNIA